MYGLQALPPAASLLLIVAVAGYGRAPHVAVVSASALFCLRCLQQRRPWTKGRGVGD
jgi:hypothetical protein